MKRSTIVAIVVPIAVTVMLLCGIGAYFLFFGKDKGSTSSAASGYSSEYDGMYYYYMNGMQIKSTYLKLRGNQWASSDGDGGTYTVDGGTLTLYRNVMGDNEIIFSGTIEDGVITVMQNAGGLPINIYYCKDGKTPQ